jgi:hypothetical protein
MRAGHPGGGLPTGRAACGRLQPPWIPHAVRACWTAGGWPQAKQSGRRRGHGATLCNQHSSSVSSCKPPSRFVDLDVLLGEFEAFDHQVQLSLGLFVRPVVGGAVKGWQTVGDVGVWSARVSTLEPRPGDIVSRPRKKSSRCFEA